MTQVITAPSLEKAEYTTVFLAGGISNCKEWQKEVIKKLEGIPVTIYNPRQENFDTADKNSFYKQIKWEYERLEKMDIFSMYFCNDNSVQPICMYELGRNIVRMQNRFPDDWESRIVISIENGYVREEDVLIQVGLCARKLPVNFNANPETHALWIERAFRYLNR